MPLRFHDLQVEMVPIDDVCQFEGNPNNGDLDAIGESIEINGYYHPVLVQRSTGRIVSGNHRYVALLDLGATEIPVIHLDIDDVEALRILLAENAIARRAVIDPALLEPLLDRLTETDVGLLGTGYDPPPEIPREHLPPIPDFADHRPVLRITCDTYAAAMDLEAELTERGFEVEPT